MRKRCLYLCVLLLFACASPRPSQEIRCPASEDAHEINPVDSRYCAAQLSPSQHTVSENDRRAFSEAFEQDELSRDSARARAVAEWNGGTRNPDLAGKIAADTVEVSVGERPVETLRIFNAAGRINNSPVRFLYLHGLTAPTSSPDALAKLLFNQTEIKEGSRRSMTREIQTLSSYLSVCGEAIALPGHRGGPKLLTQEETVEFIAQHVLRMKRETPDKNIVIFARSGSGIFVSRILKNQKYAAAANAISGVIMMSPPWAGDPAIVNGAVDTLWKAVAEERAHGEDSVIYPQLVEWSRVNRLSIDWKNFDFGGKSVLIYLGELDTEMTTGERRNYLQLAQNQSNVRVETITGQGHDTFRETRTNRTGALQSYEKFYGFLRQKILK